MLWVSDEQTRLRVVSGRHGRGPLRTPTAPSDARLTKRFDDRDRTPGVPSLERAYDRRWERFGDPSLVGAGLVLVGVGGLAVLVAMVLVGLRPESETAKEAAGIAAGLGVPAMLLGVVVVLPASRRNRLGVLAGVGLTVVGVALFWVAYPGRWTGTADPLAFETLAAYATGCVVGLWFVFSALASAQLRNVPAGTVELEVVREGETRVVEVSRDRYQDLVGDGGDTEELLTELGVDGEASRDTDPTDTGDSADTTDEPTGGARNRGDTGGMVSGAHDTRDSGDMDRL